MAHERVCKRGNPSDYMKCQRGQVLIEFSLIAVSLSLLIALVVDVARMVFIAQVLQEAARVAARELSVLPLSPTMTFEQALKHPLVKQKIFDPAALVIEVDRYESKHALKAFVDSLPIVNRMLRPLMIFDSINTDDRSRKVLRFPGEVLRAGNQDEAKWAIGIPLTETTRLSHDAPDRWGFVLEEVRENPNDPKSGSFSLQSSPHAQTSGLVALRLNYPFQAMFMNWLPQSALPDSVALQATATINSKSEVQPENHGGIGENISENSGKPLSSLTRVASSAREYQRVLTAQAVFRREVFQ